MNSTTVNKPVKLYWILLVSIAIQALGLLLFVQLEPLRKNQLTVQEQDARELDEQAKSRLRSLEERKKEKRSRTELKQEDAEKLAREEEKKRSKKLIEKLEAMKKIREEMEDVEHIKMEEIANRKEEDLGLYLYLQLLPLAQELAGHAQTQQVEVAIEEVPGVTTSSVGFLNKVQSFRQHILAPDNFQALKDSHDVNLGLQHQVNRKLDEMQAGYPENNKRISRENHLEYWVNFTQHKISGLLRDSEAPDMETMNSPPPDYATPEPLAEDWEQQLENMSAAELHEEALALHQDIQQLFTGARAAEMALNRQEALAEAFSQVSTPPPKTGFSPENTPNPPGTIGELNQLRAGLDQAVQDVNQLWQQANNMAQAGRDMAGLPSRQQGTGPASESEQGKGGSGKQAAGRAALLANAAMGNLGRNVDVSLFMGKPGESASYGAIGGGVDITHKSRRTGFQSQGDSAGAGQGAARLSESQVIKEALPGRRFSRSSDRTGWLFIDTWYVIGPWENQGRTSFSNPLPPETLVDLDAVYTGKSDMELRWQFHQSDNIRIKPPREMEASTYFGYTEVYFEEATEMLVAVATDDAAKVWINDTVIWQDRGFSPWRIDEGFRKVFFKKGFNKILFRIENGPVTCTYSLLLCPPDALPL